VIDRVAGAVNLAEFVRATAGRKGTHAYLRDGIAISSPFPVSNGYVNTAVSTREHTPDGFVDEAIAFFADRGSPFVLWALDTDGPLIADALRHGAESDGKRSPGMSVHHRIPLNTNLRFSSVSSAVDAEVLSDVAERGYAIPGFGFLLKQQESCFGEGCDWVIAYEGGVAVGAGCGFLHGTTGGIYSIATPPEHRGRGLLRNSRRRSRTTYSREAR
jgi:hypothetical protein